MAEATLAGQDGAAAVIASETALDSRPTSNGHSPDVIHERDERKYQYPGIPTTCDGAEAVVHVEINVDPRGRGVSDHQLDHDGGRVTMRPLMNG